MLGKGVVAISERQDKKYQMTAHCSEKDGAFFEVNVSDEKSSDGSWTMKKWIADQCIPMGDMVVGKGARIVIGNRVSMADTEIIDHANGFIVRFGLGRSPQVTGNPSFLYANDFGACMSEDFIGSGERMVRAITTAFRNCIQ